MSHLAICLVPSRARAAESTIDTANSPATLLCMGRHKLPDADRKSEVFRLSVTAAQRAAIDKAARAAGETTSDWARSIVRKAVRKQPKRG